MRTPRLGDAVIIVIPHAQSTVWNSAGKLVKNPSPCRKVVGAVTRIAIDGCVNVFLFEDSNHPSHFAPIAIPYDAGKSPGTFHFPEDDLPASESKPISESKPVGAPLREKINQPPFPENEPMFTGRD